MLREATGALWLPLERRVQEPSLEAARLEADEAVWGAAWDEGRAMTVDEAIIYALEHGAGT